MTDHRETSEERQRKLEDLRVQGTTWLVTGAGVAVAGLAGAALGAVCPLCVIAAPAAAGFGFVQRFRAWRGRASAGVVPSEK